MLSDAILKQVLSGCSAKRDIRSKRFFTDKCVYTGGHGLSCQPYGFEPEHVPNPEDRNIEDKEVKTTS